MNSTIKLGQKGAIYLNTEMVVQFLLEEERRLKKITRDAERRIRQAPQGNVRIVKSENRVQFFHRTDPKDTSGHYIRVEDRSIAVELIQKKYDQQVCAAVRKQSSAIAAFLKCYDPEAVKRVYERQSDVRKENIVPVELPDQEFINNWQFQKYEAKQFTDMLPEHYTSRGERVRSKSEVMIADALYRAGIAYKYECPLNLGGRVIHPDFTVLKVSDREEIYWEHLGMMDNPDYCQNALQRIRLYEANDINPGRKLVLTMETSSMPVNLTVINRMIALYCR